MTVPHHLLLVVAGRAGEPSRLVDAEAQHPQLSVLDVAATRGDGIFETISIGRGHPQALDAHLQRFARSARMLDLPAPDLALWRDAVLTIADRLADHDEAWVKTALSRGIELPGGGEPIATGWAYGTVSPDFRRERSDGIDVVMLDRGLRSDVSATSPWLLAGAKTLSYAVNRAAVREAQRRGADDVIFVSTDGLLLEGPTSTIVVRRGGELATPPDALGILPGTTQADLFAAADQWGLTTAVVPLTPDDLRAADAVWLVSSVRHAAPVRSVDGVARAVDGELTAAMNGFLRARRF
ncbi:aminodeoxychorismate lyase [Microcella humidisoli]|jgi:4-amino-4-deoxychorismate lyase|uniref:Aminodeoxychorismate lyase n=1 Tax=Microcella humidisoli TaxID=2963406 RepID=A0ABY5FWD3_9MICO|nr:aminodeoxychorismate lyase [Microcella humidisoli]UTT62603.1 aminodeoxychorismate lyase [Microcella humidisoli]